MAADVACFLDAAADLSMVWGEWDCCLFPAAWVKRRLGIDPAAHWRDRYDSEAGARAFVTAEGGLHRTMRRAARVAGLVWTTCPGVGAVGVVRADPEPMGGICTAPGFWATVGPSGGIVVTSCRSIVSWELPPHGRSYPLSG